MNFLLFILIFIYSINFAKSQIKNNNIQSGIQIEMLFPEGKTKSLILSYDDGRIQDSLLVALLNKYKLVGTFHLNSNKFDTNDYLPKIIINKIFNGHEVSVHSANHPSLTSLSKIDIIYEIVEDRRNLEELVKYPVRGMAYPFGDYNNFVIETIKDLGIEYARTTQDTYNFKIPQDFLKWHPSVHQFGKVSQWVPYKYEIDKKELDEFYKLINDFFQIKGLALLYIWGHSWELGNYKELWDETEKLYKMLSNNALIHYTTHIDLVDYINAYKNLKFSVDKNIVYNQSKFKIFFRKKEKTYSILPGEFLNLKN